MINFKEHEEVASLSKFTYAYDHTRFIETKLRQATKLMKEIS
jgi:hypothetical protein